MKGPTPTCEKCGVELVEHGFPTSMRWNDELRGYVPAGHVVEWVHPSWSKRCSGAPNEQD